MAKKEEIKIFEKGFQEGYHKAQQNLTLTWEDAEILYQCINRAWSILGGHHPQKDTFELAIKFFNESKKN
jgi:hypothetical protein